MVFGMTTTEFLREYNNFLKRNYNAKRAEKEKSYLYSEFKHYGISSPVSRTFWLKHKKYIRSLPKADAIKLIKYLWKQPSHEEKNAALTILNLHLNQLDALDTPLIEVMMRESKGWALLDNLIIPVMPTLLKKDKRAYNYLEKWIKDDDFWVRRSALLAQLLFFRTGDGGDHKLFFEFAKSQFEENWINQTYKDRLQNSRAKFFIRKAIGWTLREMSLKKPHLVFDFLKENKSKMSGLSLREGSRRLPKDLLQKLNL